MQVFSSGGTSRTDYTSLLVALSSSDAAAGINRLRRTMVCHFAAPSTLRSRFDNRDLCSERAMAIPQMTALLTLVYALGGTSKSPSPSNLTLADSNIV